MAVATAAQVHGESPPKDIRIFNSTELLSQRVRKWQPPAISSLLPLEAVPGMISLIVGKPNPDCFPFSSISIGLKGTNEQLILNETDLHDAFQYALLPGGIPELRQWFEEFQARIHGPGPVGTWGCAIGSGSQDLLYKAFQVFTDPGDYVLIDTPAYSGTLGFLSADCHNLVEVLSDAEGLNPTELEIVLSQWPDHKRRPRILYTVPTGSNPTGRSCTQARKIEILRLAKKFNFLIFEDDAYYFLDFADPAVKARSYVSLEAEVNGETGRVLRFDSLSKIVSAGMRLGFLTTSPSILQKVNMITGNTNLQAASTSQVIALALLRHWGHEGFLTHTSNAAEFYRHKRDMLVAAAERYLQDKATWEVPTAGMFLWIKLLLPPGRDSFEVLTSFSSAAGVIAVPGMAFMPSRSKTCQLRLSFSLVTEDEANEACRRIATLVESAFTEAAKGNHTWSDE
ncbi:pyridoxal phosphate-dependent transferase [Truncatella angustata]|uniref:Pyridoxal phosphate-dependent transferase n=1 Tax=Truncatella angustata TaxID=152316 RepID=A0A9P8UFS2_9PEZI|nr:pyridoxal phosphate-dependent transferase [Truncatella angustata]KAH6649107.1 pyridoxal phosphate-dependent transferase [Truncatella angustata]